jgi:membrane protease subunit (stomatin/prohibitin family)
MSENRKIEFTRNYSDLSTSQGFQFEFHCDRCGTGYRTHFKPSATARITEGISALSGLFGGVLNSAANLGEHVRTAGWKKASDEAFVEAVEELKPDFIQCPRCSTWVCRKSCFNNNKGLCKNCAPDLGVEMAAAQSSRSVEEVWAHAKMAEEDKHLTDADWREGIRATCPQCGVPLANNVKFCPECGASIKSASHCTKCGAKLALGAKFCADCGEKVV